jgi:GH15 family glucan-1,4-alpha-glucosidase
MPRSVGDYALIGDYQTAALVGRRGAIEWLCWPRFDSDACMAAILGDADNGHWRIAPLDAAATTTRRYKDETLVLETRFETQTGSALLTDFMPLGAEGSRIVRIVTGEAGRVNFISELALRFDYGRQRPWLRSSGDGLTAVAGPHAVRLSAGATLRPLTEADCVAEFEAAPGRPVAFELIHFASYQPPPRASDPFQALESTTASWRGWVGQCQYDGPWRDPVMRSLITLKALTFLPSGGVLAAPTSSLPEQPGGARNWDYRYCWLRDATFTLMSLLHVGYTQEAAGWREWLLRACAGDPDQIQPLYGVSGERRLLEWEAPWLAGFGQASPVRFGNAAAEQMQLDVYGEVVDALFQAEQHGVTSNATEQRLMRALIEHVEGVWREPDRGIWEVRGAPRRFTHSMVMAWVALDRGVRSAEATRTAAPLDRWRALRDEIHAEVLELCFDADRGAFIQAVGTPVLDASTLLIPLVGFLPPDDPRVVGTVDAIAEELMCDGFVRRYLPSQTDDGLGEDEAPFLACSFWLVDNLALQGRWDEAGEMFERLLSVSNDVGLLAEEYDPKSGELRGNFPQALSHLSLVNTALNLTTHGPAARRAQRP